MKLVLKKGIKKFAMKKIELKTLQSLCLQQNEDVPTWRKILIRSLALTKNPDPVDMTRVDMTDDLFSFQDTSKTNLITD